MIRTLVALAGILGLASALAFAATPAPHAKPASPRASASPSASASPAAAGASFSLGKWNVNTQSADFNFHSGDFSAPNHVHLWRNGTDINADRASGNFNRSFANLYGHVIIHDEQGSFGGLSSAKNAKAKGPSTLTADRAVLDGKTKNYTAEGHVHFVQADTVVDADKGTLDDQTHDLLLTGNVHITQGERSITAGTVHYNTITGQAHAENNVTMQFPSAFQPTVATPRPIDLKNPFAKKAASPHPSASPT